jgi:carbon-monoxide dehydrogenase small subunit
MNKEERQYIILTVNGQKRKLFIGTDPGEIPPSQTLAQTLRDNLGLTGLKISCDNGACGCCTVIIDGDAVPSCMIDRKSVV